MRHVPKGHAGVPPAKKRQGAFQPTALLANVKRLLGSAYVAAVNGRPLRMPKHLAARQAAEAAHAPEPRRTIPRDRLQLALGPGHRADKTGDSARGHADPSISWAAREGGFAPAEMRRHQDDGGGHCHGRGYRRRSFLQLCVGTAVIRCEPGNVHRTSVASLRHRVHGRQRAWRQHTRARYAPPRSTAPCTVNASCEREN